MDFLIDSRMRIFGLGLGADAAGFEDDDPPFADLSAFNDDALWLLVDLVVHGDFLLFLLALAFGMDVTQHGDDCARVPTLVDFFPSFADASVGSNF